MLRLKYFRWNMKKEQAQNAHCRFGINTQIILLNINLSYVRKCLFGFGKMLDWSITLVLCMSSIKLKKCCSKNTRYKDSFANNTFCMFFFIFRNWTGTPSPPANSQRHSSPRSTTSWTRVTSAKNSRRWCLQTPRP